MILSARLWNIFFRDSYSFPYFKTLLKVSDPVFEETLIWVNNLKAGFPFKYFAPHRQNFRPRKMFRWNLLSLKTLQLTFVWLNNHQLRHFLADQVQKFGVRLIFLIFRDDNFTGDKRNVWVETQLKWILFTYFGVVRPKWEPSVSSLTIEWSHILFIYFNCLIKSIITLLNRYISCHIDWQISNNISFLDNWTWRMDLFFALSKHFEAKRDMVYCL